MRFDAPALASSLARRHRTVGFRNRRAAVLLPLMGPDDDLSLLLTRRSQEMSSHRGQVAFPGGHVDASDGTLENTALREANEEVGLPPSAVCVLGMLDDLPTINNKTMVTPVVGRVGGISFDELRPSSAEVDRIFTVPVNRLMEPTAWEERQETWRGGQMRAFYFEHSGETLWGMSAYFTLMLMTSLAPELGVKPPFTLDRLDITDD